MISLVISTNNLVIPAKAGIQMTVAAVGELSWIPAFAGMTTEGAAE